MLDDELYLSSSYYIIGMTFGGDGRDWAYFLNPY